MPVAGYIIKDEDYLKLPTEDQSFLSKSDIKKYMTVVGALVYLSSYRLEVVFAVMYLSWHIQAPRQHSRVCAAVSLSQQGIVSQHRQQTPCSDHRLQRCITRYRSAWPLSRQYLYPVSFGLWLYISQGQNNNSNHLI